MEQLYRRYPDDPETAIFHALALNGAVDHADKTYARQLTAGAILSRCSSSSPIIQVLLQLVRALPCTRLR
jgi:hypothetical protein